MAYLFQIESGKVQALRSDGFPLWKRYKQVFDVLRKSLGKDIQQIFAEPDIRKDFCSWDCINLPDNALPLTSLDKEEYTRYKRLIDIKTGIVDDFAKQLQKSKDIEERKLGNLIAQMLVIPSEETIFVADNLFCIAGWGFNFVHQPPISALNLSFEKEQKEEEDQDTNKNTENKPIPIEETPKPPLPPLPDNEDKADETKPEISSEEEVEDTNIGENKVEEENNVEEEKQELNTDNQNNNGNKSNKKRKWLHCGWWCWLIPLLILLIWLCIRYCFAPAPVLPDQPNVIPPIDTTKIITDPDTIRNIVSDRLNVAITAEESGGVQAFAREFKKIYAKDVYQIIYYDTLTQRLQIQIPENERETIKSELPQKLPQFELLIWDENMFNHQYRPRDPGFNSDEKSWYHKRIGVFDVWDISRGDSNLIIAIIDDGFDLSHPEFQGKVVKARNVAEGSNTIYPQNHGTHVAGTALGNLDNGAGVSGIAPNCKFMPIQVGNRQGLMSSTAVIDAVLYAIHNGASVVNMSLGMQVHPRMRSLPQNEQQIIIDQYFKDEERFWNQLFETAYKKNVIFVLAAGNDNVMIGIDPMQRSNKTIKVSAIAPGDGKAVFSNYGNMSTISAPGVHIYSSFPQNSYNYLDGTSMAAPVVTGAVAILQSINPAMTFEQIVELMQSTGARVNAPGYAMGNILQLAQAAGIAEQQRGRMPRVDCEDLQDKIDSLYQEIEKIRRECENENASGDTLKIPPDAENTNFAEGRWRSTTHIYNELGERVTLYFDIFDDGTGEITLLEENNTACKAQLRLNLQTNQLIMDQLTPADCSPANKQYSNYYFECSTDANGNAHCWAKNKRNNSNNFDFNLVKIR